MKTVRIHPTRRAIVAFIVLLPLFSTSSMGQRVLTDLSTASNQADYVIITSPSYVDILRPLAEFRAQHDGLTSAFALTDSIYSQFGTHASPDSSLKTFIMHALSVWNDPKPRFFLLGGNLDAVPGHRVASELAMVGEDSVLLDSWYMLSDDGPGTPMRPRAALGRLPASDAVTLESMVTKTIGYGSGQLGVWSERVIALADSLAGGVLFERDASAWQSHAVRLWPDTLTGHLRTTSPQAWSTDQFLRALDDGVAFVAYWGEATIGQVGTLPYFTPGDVQRIEPNSALAFWMLSGSHAFDLPADSSVTLSLLTAEDKGAVAVAVSAGKHYLGSYQDFMLTFVDKIVASPSTAIGTHLQAMIQSHLTSEQSFAGRLTLLGDPAVVVANPLIAAIDPPRGGEIPLSVTLFQNYPNPFNPTTTIRYALPQKAFIRLAVFNTLGQEVATLTQGEQEAGYHEVRFDASGLASGVYLYRLQAGESVQSRRLILLR